MWLAPLAARLRSCTCCKPYTISCCTRSIQIIIQQCGVVEKVLSTCREKNHFRDSAHHLAVASYLPLCVCITVSIQSSQQCLLHYQAGKEEQILSSCGADTDKCMTKSHDVKMETFITMQVSFAHASWPILEMYDILYSWKI